MAYNNFVHSRFVVRVARLVVLLCALLVVTAMGAPGKSIRLRNETITPTTSVNSLKSLAAAANDDPTNGLFLIQFTSTPQAAWREPLRGLGVELLQYVPDDAFIARFDGAQSGKIRQLEFVRWVGRYSPEHKLHQALTHASGVGTNTPGQFANASPSSDSLDVAVLLSPLATAVERQQTRSRFSQTRQESSNHFGAVLRGRLNRAQLDALASSEAVLWIEPAPAMRLYDEVASRIVAGDGPPGQTLAQSLGYTGAGVNVAVADSGLDSGDTNDMHLDIQGRVHALFYYGAPGQLDGPEDEHSHGTHVAGIIAGNGATGETDENGFLYGLGVAPGASVIAQRIFDGDGGYAPPPSFEALTRDAKRAGADIGSNSWGDDTQGRYDLSAMEFDGLVRDADALTFGDQPYILEFSAGNAGPGYQTVGSPAVAKNVIATGASQNERFNLPLDEFAIYDEGRDAMTDFSSRGPCEDGRIKPDLVAPGSWIASLRSVYANDDYAWWPISDNYMYQGGTSQAGPHVSGAAAVFVQYWRTTHAGATPSPALVKAALINSAADMDDGFSTDAVPNEDEGWGRVDLPALIASTRNHDFTDQTVLLTNGGVFEKRVLVASAGEPLKITLTYTDEPGLPAAVIALVNDLDLEVIAPDGHFYRGNYFEDGESVPDAPLPDTVNNVEAVHLLAPVPGEYIIRIRGRRVVEDARRDTVPLDQDFALVVSGAFAAPGTGIVTFDRRVYRVPDQINLALADYDLAGQGSANILLRSTLESGGETITLQANGSSGLFTGTVATATSPVMSDGKLQVAHGNAIEAVYADASPSSNRVFTALADLQPPVISNLHATNQFGQVAVSWNTDEPARGEVYYGLSSPNLSLTNRTLEMDHGFALSGLAANAVVKFFAVSQDEAGNRATNDNGGNFFTITNLQPPSVLLVDSFADYYSFGFLIVAAPPLSGYTDALNQLGVAYNIFDARSNALPSQAQLDSYRCVIWRVSDLDAPSATLAQRITSYVNNGGALFLASMEAVSRFAGAGLASFNTGTLHVQSYTEDQVVNEIAGQPGEALGNGINTTLDYAAYEDILALAGTEDASDWIVPATGAATAILSDGAIVGLRAPKTGVDMPGRVVFLSFPLDAVPLGSGIGNNRAGLLHNALNFLAPPANTSALTLDSDVYSVPGRAIVEVEDADLQGQGLLAVNVHSPQHSDQLALTLVETVRSGLFRGSLIFVPTNTGIPGTYLVNANDSISFDYFDVSAAVTVSATATIETNAPIISDVVIEAGYLEALVSWETSEPADALVQYSESPIAFPNNLTAYDPSPATFHTVLLNGLKPSTTYYVKVSSRDRAGNNTTDDNGGSNYITTTLLPHLTPWSDNIETNSVEWSTFTPTESESAWTRGTPGGGESAHSGSNCWGSNLDGGSIVLAESSLISPAVSLAGGNKATLRFWQNYDFSLPDDFHLAFIEIITNVTTPSQLIALLPADYTDGWKPAEYDLTPYLNHVVYIVWHHLLYSEDELPDLGWLVDDVSITVDNVVPGTIQITNNLWQTVYALSGPSGRTGNGRWTVLTNAAPGEYTIQYGDVPYYTTPPSQTNTLAPGGLITFQSTYTFPDANNNGIPDPYESAQFGALDPAHTKATDTDHDGMSDWAEFVAGTDPNNPPPPFRLTARHLGNGGVQLAWPSVTNHTYRVHASVDAVNWSPYTAFLPAGGTTTTFTLPTPTNGAPKFFRVEAAPPSGPTAIAPFLRVNATKLPNGLVRLDWPASIGHGYRIVSSSDAATWTPATEWIRAASASAGTTNLPAGNLMRLFRVEAQP